MSKIINTMTVNQSGVPKVALTGIAAINVKRKTAHSLFKIMKQGSSSSKVQLSDLEDYQEVMFLLSEENRMPS